MVKHTGVNFVAALTFFIGSATVSAVAAQGSNLGDAGISGDYDWSGWYFGLKGGYGSGDSRGISAGGDTGYHKIKGSLLGVMGSFDVQSDNIVFGLDMDAAFANFKAKTSPTNSCANCETKINWLGTLRGRVGYTANRVMPFVAAGIAFGGAEVTIPAAGWGKKDDIRVGYTLGAGLDWLIADGLRGRLEYQLVDLGNKTLNFAAGPTDSKIKDLHLVRVGISIDLSRILKQTSNGN